MPSGKLGAEATIMMVLALLCEESDGTLTEHGSARQHAHSTRNPVDIGPPGLLVDRDDADLDTEVLGGFEERCMCRGRHDPSASQQREGRSAMLNGDIHFRRGDAFGSLGPVPIRLDGHEDGLGAARSRYRGQSGV